MDWLKKVRKEKNMTQKAVAAAVGVTRVCYTNYENGVRRPSVETAKVIARVLGFDWTKFYEEV